MMEKRDSCDFRFTDRSSSADHFKALVRSRNCHWVALSVNFSGTKGWEGKAYHVGQLMTFKKRSQCLSQHFINKGSVKKDGTMVCMEQPSWESVRLEDWHFRMSWEQSPLIQGGRQSRRSWKGGRPLLGKQLTLQHCFRASAPDLLAYFRSLSKVTSSIQLSCSVMSDSLQPH